MKKIGILALVFVFAFGALGIGYAHWQQTLYIDGTVNTGNFLVTFCNGGRADLRGAISNDDNVNNLGLWCNGPLGYGVPVYPDPDDDGGDPTVAQTMGQNVDRTDDWASTQAIIDHSNPPESARHLTVSIDNGYPSYHPTVFFTIRNWGTIPAKVTSIKVTQVSVNTTTYVEDIDLGVCTPVGLDCDKDGDIDLTVHLSDDEGRLFQVIEAGGGQYGQHGFFESAVCGNLDVHIEQGAEQNTTYDFTVEIVVSQYNLA